MLSDLWEKNGGRSGWNQTLTRWESGKLNKVENVLRILRFLK